MLNRFMTVVILIPLAIILIALAVANRAPVAFTLDPFNPGNPGLTIAMPMFVFLFAALAIGLLIGSMATWLRQGRYRKLARQRENELQTIRKAPSAANTDIITTAPALPRPNA